ncbi:MAG: hypothetical protein HIU82_20055 [Proteobacteria bacterium]|nr:hypothetical protein [Pseudomonadota bacterium]
MFAHMIPASFIDRLTAILVWLAERLAEIRERNALRAQAELEQAEREQAELEQAALEQAEFEHAAREQAEREESKCEPAGDAHDPALAATLAADAAPAGPDVRDGSRGRLPVARLRPSPAILPPDGRADAATAVVDNAGARMPHVSLPYVFLADIAARCGLARPRWSRQVLASARVRGADGVGWDANSGQGRRGLRTS